MVQPIEKAISWFYSIFNLLPVPIWGFICLNFVMFIIAAALRLLWRAR